MSLPNQISTWNLQLIMILVCQPRGKILISKKTSSAISTIHRLVPKVQDSTKVSEGSIIMISTYHVRIFRLFRFMDFWVWALNGSAFVECSLNLGMRARISNLNDITHFFVEIYTYIYCINTFYSNFLRMCIYYIFFFADTKCKNSHVVFISNFNVNCFTEIAMAMDIL